MWLKTALSKCGNVFRKRPFATNVASYGFFYVSAEITQQLLDKKLRKGTTEGVSLDLEALSRYAIIGTAGIGPGLFFWYKLLDKWIPYRAPRYVVAKVVVDQAISSPACLAVFFIGMSFLEGKDDIFEEFKKKFVSTYMVSCCFWPTVQAVNFGLLPPHTRVAFVGGASFLWANVLCLMKRRSSADENADTVPANPDN